MLTKVDHVVVDRTLMDLTVQHREACNRVDCLV
jgi:hypothetical protein